VGESWDENFKGRCFESWGEMKWCHKPSASRPALIAVPLPDVALDIAPFVCEHKRQINLPRMVAQIAGCSITAEAWRPAGRLAGAQSDLSDTFHFLYEEVESYLEKTKHDFTTLVQKKGLLYSIERTNRAIA